MTPVSVLLLVAVVCGVAGCDSTSVAPSSVFEVSRAGAPSAAPAEAPIPTYFGEEYAAQQRALLELAPEPAPSAF